MRLLIKLILILTILVGNNLFACTLFSFNQEKSHALVGNNGDSDDHTYEYYYIEPGEEGKYGAIYFGSDKDKQSAINERGLFFADAAIPTWSIEKYPKGRNTCGTVIRKKLMQECSTVDEAIQLLKKSNTSMFRFIHMLLADRTGKSVLVEWNGEELEFIEKKGDFQIATNFLVSQMKDENRVSCKRYRATRNLLMTHEASIETCRAVLDAAHQNTTQYSLIGDLQLGLIYLFAEHDYEKVGVINVSKELQRGEKKIQIREGFNFQAKNVEGKSPPLSPLQTLAIPLHPV